MSLLGSRFGRRHLQRHRPRPGIPGCPLETSIWTSPGAKRPTFDFVSCYVLSSKSSICEDVYIYYIYIHIHIHVTIHVYIYIIIYIYISLYKWDYMVLDNFPHGSSSCEPPIHRFRCSSRPIPAAETRNSGPPEFNSCSCGHQRYNIILC